MQHLKQQPVALTGCLVAGRKILGMPDKALTFPMEKCSPGSAISANMAAPK